MRKVIYTSLVGNYDALKDPAYIMKDWDYICFSDNLNQKDFLVWKIYPVPYHVKNPQRKSRYAKLNPHKVLQAYDYSLWMDANIEIISPLFEQLIQKKVDENVLISIPKHSQRNCIYKEAELVYSPEEIINGR